MTINKMGGSAEGENHLSEAGIASGFRFMHEL